MVDDAQIQVLADRLASDVPAGQLRPNWLWRYGDARSGALATAAVFAGVLVAGGGVIRRLASNTDPLAAGRLYAQTSYAAALRTERLIGGGFREYLVARWTGFAKSLPLLRHQATSTAGRDMRALWLDAERRQLAAELHELGLDPESASAKRLMSLYLLLGGSLALLELHDRQALSVDDAADEVAWAAQVLLAATRARGPHRRPDRDEVEATRPMTTYTVDAPPPGTWIRFSDHFPHTLTPEYTRLYRTTFEPAQAAVYERYGVPFAGLATVIIDGHLYLGPELADRSRRALGCLRGRCCGS